ncbi:hypothetical protein ACM55G_01025 [Flavobacterium sp. LB3P122]|uniref:hypothetical protein n=1 Tax=Flavobacterium algoriphilum TaxID=3398738 RepID=UPI003A8AF0FF
MKSEKLEKLVIKELSTCSNINENICFYEGQDREIIDTFGNVQKTIDNQSGYEINYNIFKNEAHKKEILSTSKSLIGEYLEDLFKISKEENYFWELCSFTVYKDHYNKRLENFLFKNDNEFFDEITFIEMELKILNNLHKQRFYDFLRVPTLELIKKASSKKIFFLNEKLSMQKQSDDIVQLLDLDKISGIEKIIYLQKLGIIDFLSKKQPFISSINSLANILSIITSVKSGTIQPMINPIINNDTTSKNHPLNSKKNVQKIETHLIKIGFDLNETN